MTNLYSSNKKNKIITPENSLLFIPVFIGIFILSSLLILIYRPLHIKILEEEAQINILKEKISYIPIYNKYINELSKIRNKVKRQQERLIELISDPNELDTILSEINKISDNIGIEIIKIIPQPIIKYNIYESINSGNSKNILYSDPLLIPTVEKHMFKISLRGDYNKFINFLKQLERLQTIVISDNIEIKSQNSQSNESPLNLIMNFDLSTYANKGYKSSSE